MIRHINTLPPINSNKLSGAKILSLYKSFGESRIAPDFWVQEIEGEIAAVLCLYGSEMTLYCENAEINEIREFIKVISPKSIFTEKENTLYDKFTSKLIFLKQTQKNSETNINSVSLKELYSNLSMGIDGDVWLPSFEDFAPDISHRLRHDGAIALTTEYGAALCFLFDGGGIISGISVEKSLRKKGLGSKLLKELSNHVDGKIFACTEAENKDFYMKNGFSLIGEAVIIEMDRL